ncbi:MAG: hypothetical protein RL726_568, partial [Actinomycetota bacterium]
MLAGPAESDPALLKGEQVIRLSGVARKSFGIVVVMLAVATTMTLARSTSLAIAPAEAFTWQISGPSQIRFQGVASSKTGDIA